MSGADGLRLAALEIARLGRADRAAVLDAFDPPVRARLSAEVKHLDLISRGDREVLRAAAPVVASRPVAAAPSVPAVPDLPAEAATLVEACHSGGDLAGRPLPPRLVRAVQDAWLKADRTPVAGFAAMLNGPGPVDG